MSVSPLTIAVRVERVRVGGAETSMVVWLVGDLHEVPADDQLPAFAYLTKKSPPPRQKVQRAAARVEAGYLLAGGEGSVGAGRATELAAGEHRFGRWQKPSFPRLPPRRAAENNLSTHWVEKDGTKAGALCTGLRAATGYGVSAVG